MASFRKAQKAFVSKKMSEASAFGMTKKLDTPAKKKKRAAAAKQARQAGGTGRLLGSPRKLRPRKLLSFEMFPI